MTRLVPSKKNANCEELTEPENLKCYYGCLNFLLNLPNYVATIDG